MNEQGTAGPLPQPIAERSAIGPYSQAYEVNGVIYTSGKIPVDPATGNIDRGTKIPGSELIDCGEDCSKGIENLSARRKDVSGCGV